jgi:uncharacterized protein involved in exopolysaccharide biosynthesis
MNVTMQFLGAYVLFVLITLTILFCVVGCAMIAMAAYEASAWIRVHYRNIRGVSRLAKATSH